MNDDIFKKECDKLYYKLKEINKDIWIYGAGRCGELLYNHLANNNVNVVGFIDEKYNSIKKKYGLPVVCIDDVIPNESYVIVSLMEFNYEVLVMLRTKGFSENNVYFISRYDYNTESIQYHGATIGKYTKNYGLFMSFAPNLVNKIGAFCSINETSRCYNNHPTKKVSTFLF